ncbi:MAG TPA: hypothetical protein DCP69_02855 [Candidatus Omnitrophica bacterium]|nr:hypothetical protein [Candidatus Omnitrophota bacterium]HLE03091.1 hypothetical protein [Anaerolineales bacterium]
MPESVTVGELLVRIRADVTDLEAGLKKTQTGFEGMGTRIRPGLRAVEGGLRGLAISAAGLPGPFGRLASALLRFAPGGFVTLGVIAGVGAIALIWREFTKRAEEARKEVEANARTLIALADARRRFQAGAAEQGLGLSRTRLDELLDIQARVRISLRQIQEEMARLPGFVFGIIPEDVATRLREAQTAMKSVTEAIADQRMELARAQEAAAAFWKEWARISKERPIGRGAAIAPKAEEFRAQVFGAFKGTPLKQITRDLPSMADVDAWTNRWIEPFAKQVQARYEFFQEIGQTIGNALADGIYSIMSGGNFFQSIGRSLLGIGLNLFSRFAGAAIGNALFPGGGAIIGGLLSGGGGGPTMGKSVAPGAGLMTINLGNMPAATNPLAATRDAQWQVFLKESLLVGRAGGFR